MSTGSTHWRVEGAIICGLAIVWGIAVASALRSLRDAGMFTEMPDLLFGLLFLIPMPLTYVALRFHLAARRSADCPRWLRLSVSSLGLAPVLLIFGVPFAVYVWSAFRS